MVGFKAFAAGIAVAAGCVAIADAETLTIATVNNRRHDQHEEVVVRKGAAIRTSSSTG